MTSKFEQLIEYVINDEEAKAKELFHDIVVEKSREIYENLMAEEAEELEEADDLDEGIDDMEEMSGTGDAAENFMDEVEVEENGMMEGDDEAEAEDTADHHDDIGGNEGLEDRVVDLEDKLDELMAEFEAMMDGEDQAAGDGDMMGPDEGGDAIEMDDTEEFTDQGDDEFKLAEGVDLKAAPKPTTTEEGSVNKHSTVKANSGAAGAIARPVTPTGTEAKGRPAPTVKELGVASTQDAGSKAFKTAAPKPVTTQAAGVNARTPFPKG
jgi:hypothetical protein